MASNNQVVRLSPTFPTSDEIIQTISNVTNAMRKVPYVFHAERTAQTRMPDVRMKAQIPPSTRIESAVLCAVSFGAKPAALTKDPAPWPKNGACTNARHPAAQMLIRWFRSPFSKLIANRCNSFERLVRGGEP